MSEYRGTSRMGTLAILAWSQILGNDVPTSLTLLWAIRHKLGKSVGENATPLYNSLIKELLFKLCPPYPLTSLL